MKYAAYTGTRNMYHKMIPSIKSLLINSDVNKIYLLIEDDIFPEYLPPEVEIINVSDQNFFKPDTPNMQSQFTYMAMMRIALCHVLPGYIDKVLVLDSDTIINRNISHLWDLNIGDNYFAAAPETHKTNNGFLYCNIGVTLYNLAELRKGKADEIIDVLNRRKYTWVEQDVNNFLCQGRIFEISGEYNANSWTQHGDNPYVWHYAGIADWINMPLVQYYMDIPWDNIRRSVWIPCTEHLPKDQTRKAVQVTNGWIITAWYDGEDGNWYAVPEIYDENNCLMTLDDAGYNVIAWRELPEEFGYEY